MMGMEKKTMMKKANIYGDKKSKIGTGTIRKIKKLSKEETQYTLIFLILFNKLLQRILKLRVRLPLRVEGLKLKEDYIKLRKDSAKVIKKSCD